MINVWILSGGCLNPLDVSKIGYLTARNQHVINGISMFAYSHL